ncbi:hypothetical protein ACFL02_10170, partial [Planctomycetota bacterium]
QTGRQRKLFADKHQISSLAMSQDENMLAFFLVQEGKYQLQIWHRDNERFESIDVSWRDCLQFASDLVRRRRQAVFCSAGGGLGKKGSGNV